MTRSSHSHTLGWAWHCSSFQSVTGGQPPLVCPDEERRQRHPRAWPPLHGSEAYKSLCPAWRGRPDWRERTQEKVIRSALEEVGLLLLSHPTHGHGTVTPHVTRRLGTWFSHNHSTWTGTDWVGSACGNPCPCHHLQLQCDFTAMCHHLLVLLCCLLFFFFTRSLVSGKGTTEPLPSQCRITDLAAAIQSWLRGFQSKAVYSVVSVSVPRIIFVASFYRY